LWSWPKPYVIIHASTLKYDIRYLVLNCDHLGLNRYPLPSVGAMFLINIVVGKTAFGKFKVAAGIGVLLQPSNQQSGYLRVE
jgi:hypothetical protein